MCFDHVQEPSTSCSYYTAHSLEFFLEINNQCGFTLTGFGDDTKVSFCQLKGNFKYELKSAGTN